SSRAWAKKEGTFAATLDGSAFDCPDVSVDSVRISLSPYPEPVSALNPDTTIAACAAAGVVLQAVTVPDTSFSYLWFDGDSVSPKTVRFAYDSLFFASVEVNGYCTSFRDSTRIRFLPPYVELSGDSLLCTFQTFADTSMLLCLTARQDYFPDADWIFRWRINGMEASDNDSLVLRYADLQKAGGDLWSALVTVAVSLSDADVDGCTARDTLVFSMASLPNDSANIFLPQSEILCAHQDIDIFVPAAADAYRCYWLDRDSIELPYGHDTTRYTVQGMRGLDGFGAGTDTREPRFFQLRLDHKVCGVSFFDTLLVYDQVKPKFELLCHDTLICRNEPVELDSLSPHVYRPFYVFEWNDGSKGSNYTFTDSGTYVLDFFVNKKYDFCGYDTASDTIHVLWVDPAMTDIFIPADTTFCKDLSVTLDVRVPYPSTQYSWQEGPMPDPEDDFEEEQDSIEFTPPVRTIKEEGTYNVLLLDTMGCRNRKEINVTIDECKPAIEIPNVFTPNDDGVNDVLRFKQLEKCTDVVVEIVNRWGQPVMKKKVATADDFEWNGRVNNTGTRLPDGPYFYMVTYKNLYGKSKVQSGSITILGTAE
ncbi:MAG: gliding motility-associated C-terminal domain-containing protein, partial [Bacteroidales bacterium]|nr:gliding motility-associated C-terminal domain-containing protein [Bacteroidales bacterium]